MDEHLRIEFNEWVRAGRGESMERGHRPVGEQAIEEKNEDSASPRWNIIQIPRRLPR